MTIIVQIVTDDANLPAASAVEHWARHALEHEHTDGELTVRIVGLDEGQQLNSEWRGREQATNVLAFPLGEPDFEPRLLGDIVICAPVANAECGDDPVAREAHWAHLAIHGVLHLLGYDHERESDAETMESRERTILAELGYPDPYA
jgi:probable rRNA maturation factor